MKLSEMTINTAGMLRCCIDTVDRLDPDREFSDGEVIDCIHETTRKGSIIVKGNKFCWNDKKLLDTDAK